MPEISVRGLEMPESPIRKLAPLAAAAKERGVKVYHLNIGQPDLPTPQVGLDALKHIDRKVLSILHRQDASRIARNSPNITSDLRLTSPPMTSSSRRADRRQCSSHSCRVLIRATRLSSLSLPMPTTWRLPSRQVPRFAP